MKKFLAIVLAMLMVLSLFACGGTTAPSAAPTSQAPVSIPPSEQVNSGNWGDDPMDAVGFFDPDFDYTKNEKFKVQYMVSTTGPLYDMFSNAFAFWAAKMNIEYMPLWASGGDNDVFLNNLSTFIDQGVDGFLMDADEAVFPRIVEITEEAGVPWISCMGMPIDVDDEARPLILPYVGFDNTWFGAQMATRLIEYKDTEWKDVPAEEIGYIALDFSVAGVLHERATGAQAVWMLKNIPENFFMADTVTTGPSLDGANTTVTAVVSDNPQITHWLCSALFDDMAMGSAAAFDTMGLTENACVTTIGGTSLQRQWDSGTQDSWRFAMFTPQTIYAEPILGALYAFMTKEATPETIWPSWIDKSTTNKYATLKLPSYWMDHDNYKKLLEWSDVYAGANEYNYDATGLTRETFNARMDIPASYAGK